MPPEAEYALLPSYGYGMKPFVYRTLADLARRIHRDRGQDALELRPAVIPFRGGHRKVTEVLAHDQRSERARRIGYAWHGARPLEALKEALDAELMRAAEALQLARAL